SLRSKLQLATLCSKASKSFGAELFNPSRNERSKTNRFAGGYAPPKPRTARRGRRSGGTSSYYGSAGASPSPYRRFGNSFRHWL
ncbi:MAG: hypothetical protein WAM53_20400, partial [Terrimicrobiaceae bacterium]